MFAMAIAIEFGGWCRSLVFTLPHFATMQDWILAVNLLLSWDDQKTTSASDMEEFLSRFLEVGLNIHFCAASFGAWPSRRHPNASAAEWLLLQDSKLGLTGTV